MSSARLAFFTLAGGLLAITGCASVHDNECHTSGWFNRFHLTSRTTGAPCDCEGGMPMTSSDGTMVMPPNAVIPPGAFAAPPTIMTNPPMAPGNQPPRIVPIPQQANPVPYTPQ